MTRAAVDHASRSDEPEVSSKEPVGKDRRLRRWTRGRPRRLSGRAVFFGLMAAAAAGLLFWLMSWWSPIPIREVAVTGAAGDAQASILTAAGIPIDTPIRELDRAAIEQRVGSLPGVDTVDLELARPWTVVVNVVERFPFAVVAKGDGWTVIDAGGAEINEQPKKPPGLPVVAGDGDRTPILQALQALPPQLREKTAKGAVDKEGDVLLTMKTGTEIRWGLPGSDDATKAQAVAVLLQYKPEKVDVTVPERPALAGELTLPKENRAPSDAP
jgi:cell division protein FtsQ